MLLFRFLCSDGNRIASILVSWVGNTAVLKLSIMLVWKYHFEVHIFLEILGDRFPGGPFSMTQDSLKTADFQDTQKKLIRWPQIEKNPRKMETNSVKIFREFFSMFREFLPIFRVFFHTFSQKSSQYITCEKYHFLRTFPVVGSETVKKINIFIKTNIFSRYSGLIVNHAKVW